MYTYSGPIIEGSRLVFDPVFSTRYKRGISDDSKYYYYRAVSNIKANEYRSVSKPLQRSRQHSRHDFIGPKFQIEKINACTYRIRQVSRDVITQWPQATKCQWQRPPNRSVTPTDNKSIRARLNKIVEKHDQLQSVFRQTKNKLH